MPLALALVPGVHGDPGALAHSSKEVYLSAAFSFLSIVLFGTFLLIFEFISRNHLQSFSRPFSSFRLFLFLFYHWSLKIFNPKIILVWARTRQRACIGGNCVGARDEAIQCAPSSVVSSTTLAPPLWGHWGPWSACRLAIFIKFFETEINAKQPTFQT